MKPDEFQRTAIAIYGRKGWKKRLARDLGVDYVTIYRIGKREQVPGPYEVALRGLLEHHRRKVELEKAARKLLPKMPRSRLTADERRAVKRARTARRKRLMLKKAAAIGQAGDPS